MANPLSPHYADIAVLDRDTGADRLFVEVTLRTSPSKVKQFTEVLRFYHVHVGLLVDPQQTRVLALRSFADSSAKIESLSSEWVCPPRVWTSEHEFAYQVHQALKQLSDQARSLRYEAIPPEFFPDVVTALENGNLVAA